MSLIDRLARLDSCALSDALDKLGLGGVVTGLSPLTGPARISGRIVTVELVGAHGSTAPKRHLCTAAIEAAAPLDVLVVAHRDRPDCAGWGGLLSLAAKARGLAGTIVDGSVRDVDEARELGYPVFARRAVPATARGRVVERAWNVPVRIGDVVARPGDLVLADGSGVVFVAAERAEEIVAAAEKIAEREARMADALRSGSKVEDVLGGAYETLLNEEREDG